VQGLGMMLSEDVKIDSATGRLLSDSTWTYKIPGAGAYKLTLQLQALVLKDFLGRFALTCVLRWRCGGMVR